MLIRAGEGHRQASTDGRQDRSLLALLEIGAAALLIVAVLLPWFQVGYQNGPSGSSIALTDYQTADLDWAQFVADWLIPLGAIAAVAAALVGLGLPGRGEVLAILAAFATAGVGVLSQVSEISSGAMNIPGFSTTSAGPGLWLFAGAAGLGAGLAVFDLARGGSSTTVWRALGEPSTRRFGLFLGYAALLAVSLLVGLYPMFPRWWLLGFGALLLAPLWVRARRLGRRRPRLLV
jgi:hypothetical protein